MSDATRPECNRARSRTFTMREGFHQDNVCVAAETNGYFEYLGVDDLLWPAVFFLLLLSHAETRRRNPCCRLHTCRAHTHLRNKLLRMRRGEPPEWRTLLSTI